MQVQYDIRVFNKKAGIVHEGRRARQVKELINKACPHAASKQSFRSLPLRPHLIDLVLTLAAPRVVREVGVVGGHVLPPDRRHETAIDGVTVAADYNILTVLRAPRAGRDHPCAVEVSPALVCGGDGMFGTQLAARAHMVHRV